MLGTAAWDPFIRSTVQLILASVTASTSGVLAGSMVALSGNPEQAASLRANPQLATQATAEMLRHAPSIQPLSRLARSDLTVGGLPIARRQRVHSLLAAALRDSRVNDRPGEIDLSHRPGRSLGFGTGCTTASAAALARMESRLL